MTALQHVYRFGSVRELCQWLSVERRDRGLSLRDIGGLAGITQRAVYTMEKGESDMRASNLAAVADALGYELALLRKDGAQ